MLQFFDWPLEADIKIESVPTEPRTEMTNFMAEKDSLKKAFLVSLANMSNHDNCIEFNIINSFKLY